MKVIIIGAGVSGLIAARHLLEKNHEVQLIEASNRIGGRIKTDEMNGFLLDHGFQVLLTDYPEVERYLDVDALKLKYFAPGALILKNKGSKTEFVDPQRGGSWFQGAFNGIGTFGDKMKLLKIKNELCKMEPEDHFTSKEMPTLQKLKQEYGFSDKIIDQFFRPFFGGIFLDKSLITSSRMFDFVYAMFSSGKAAVPTAGMGEIPKQLAEGIPKECFIFNETVTEVVKQKVLCKSGKTFEADKIILTTEIGEPETNWKSTTCVYFDCDKLPISKPIIALKAGAKGLVNNMTVLSKVAPDYAPQGRHLLSVTCLGLSKMDDIELMNAIKEEMKPWFGGAVNGWHFLKRYNIKKALPEQMHISNFISKESMKVHENVIRTGDYLLNGSLNAAMKSGRLAAEAVY